MVSNTRTLILSLIVMLAIGGTAFAQKKADDRSDRENLTVTGFEQHGGFVNYVEGTGRCICAQPPNDKAKQPLISGDAIDLSDGRAEAVLIPGYYLRLANHTRARILDLSRDNLKIEITSGSAIIEIPIEENQMLPTEIQEIKDRLFNSVTVITSAGEYAIFKAGGYRFDVVSGHESRVKVLKGAVAAGGHILKNGDAATSVAGAVGLESAERYPEDAFDEWSRKRAAALVASNKSLKHSEWYKQMTSGEGYLDFRDDTEKGAGGSSHVVSARRGVAVYVENGATVKSNDSDWRELKSGIELADGDRLRTVPNYRAVLLPYPDFELYLNGNTETVYQEDSDGNVAINVVRGSIVLLVSQTKVKRAERNTLKLSVKNTDYAITSAGYYRLNVFSSDQSEMLVYSGSVVSPGGEVGGGKRISVHSQSRTVSPFDKDARDSFDIWSDRRNARALLDARRRRWHAGLWFLDPATSEYTFVPGGRVCKSPYGGSYSTMYLLNRSGGGFRPPSRSIFRP
jgi:hypothetical protein